MTKHRGLKAEQMYVSPGSKPQLDWPGQAYDISLHVTGHEVEVHGWKHDKSWEHVQGWLSSATTDWWFVSLIEMHWGHEADGWGHSWVWELFTNPIVGFINFCITLSPGTVSTSGKSQGAEWYKNLVRSRAKFVLLQCSEESRFWWTIAVEKVRAVEFCPCGVGVNWR